VKPGFHHSLGKLLPTAATDFALSPKLAEGVPFEPFFEICFRKTLHLRAVVEGQFGSQSLRLVTEQDRRAKSIGALRLREESPLPSCWEPLARDRSLQ
jgi:hypothetical protein